MSYENVKLWFAKDDHGAIVTIDEINKNNTYSCPICGSNLKPKALTSKRVTPHFAHVDASKCNSETIIHWWFKHKFLENGDKFTVISDEEKYYVVDNILTEQSYQVENGTYKPDVTILTECGEIIYFEMAFTNKKSVKDYLDSWIELGNIVVEIDIKDLMFKNEIPKFKALFYDGKCFNTKRNDMYYNTIGKYKEKKLKGEVDEKLKERILKLDWFWEDMIRFKKDEISANDLTEIVKYIEIYEKFIVNDIIKRNKCNELKDLKEYLKKEIRNYKTIHHFNYSIKRDDQIKEAIKKLNDHFKEIDNGFKVAIDSNSVKRKRYKYTNYRKIGYWETDYYYYRVELQHKLGKYITSFDVTTYVNEMNDSHLIFNYFYEKMKNCLIKIDCIECDTEFSLSLEEINFYKSKSLKLPKRCKNCRDKRKRGVSIIAK